MTFQVRIQNLGKLADATVRVAPLTVLAGPNNAGKSFFSKCLYSLLDTVNQNLVAWRVQGFTRAILDCLKSVEYVLASSNSAINRSALSKLIAMVRLVEEMSASLELGNAPLSESHPDFTHLVEMVVAKYGEIAPAVEQAANEEGTPRIGPETHHERLTRGLGGLSRFSTWTGTEIALEGAGSAFAGNLLAHFQVGDLSSLNPGGKSSALSLEVSGIGGCKIINMPTQDLFHFSEEWEGIPYPVKTLQFDPGLFALRRDSGAIYLESPTLWKLTRALKIPRHVPSGIDRWEVDGTPKYLNDVMVALARERSGPVVFPQALESLTGKDSIGGKIVHDDLGQLFFNDNGMYVPLTTTAMGVANMGILALLIERKVLDRETFLFIDEPEAHLHPAWQVEMMRALFELARGGVHVVMATHSSDMMERLSMLVKENPETQDLVALNHFSPDGKGGARVVDSDKDFMGQLDAIQKELTDPFFTSYMEAL